MTVKCGHGVALGSCLFVLALFSCPADAGETAQPITSERAIEIALSHTGDGEVVDLGMHHRGDGPRYYRLEILGSKGAFHVEIDATSGGLIQFIRKGGRGGRWGRGMSAVPAPGDSGAHLTLEQAEALALGHTGGGVVVERDVDYKRRSGRKIYEFEIVNDGVEYEVEIDAASGNVVDFEVDGKRRRIVVREAVTGAATPAPAPNPPSSPSPADAPAASGIGSAAAQILARERIGGGVIVEYRLEKSGGKPVHEVVVEAGGRRHRLEVDDATGSVKELSVRDVE